MVHTHLAEQFGGWAVVAALITLGGEAGHDGLAFLRGVAAQLEHQHGEPEQDHEDQEFLHHVEDMGGPPKSHSRRADRPRLGSGPDEQRPSGRVGAMSDLFASAAEDRLAGRAPLAERLRPRSLDDVLGQGHLTGPGRPLRTMIDRKTLRSIILFGPAGTGKTTLARLITTELGHAFEHLSAVSASVKDIRSVADAAASRLGMSGTATVLFLDEIHRFTRSQQDALLPHVESGLITLIGATTESPWATVNRPLLSRTTVLELKPLDEATLGALADRGLALVHKELSPEARRMIVGSADGDGRRLLTAVEMAADLAPAGVIDEDTMTAALGAGIGHYDRGDHYDAASAFIKHMRAGNVDQAVAWVNHMLDGGEDPRFIARRMVIFASEDVGLADRSSLLIATAAANATEFVGMPEVRYSLTHATIVLARAPKSREVGEYMAKAPTITLEPPPGA